MKSASVRIAVVLGTVAMVGILGMQAFWFSRSLDSARKEFHQTVSIALLNVAKSIAEYNGTILPSSGLIKRIASNYYVVNLNDVINANLLEFYLLEEFGNLGLHTNFEYAIYDCASNDMVYGNFCNVEDPEFTQESNQQLPTYDEFIYYFGVKFPNRTSMLMADMRLSIVFSVITLLALIFFCYAIIIMLKQKRLSELQRDFINNMTHEFKTPISSIKVSSDVLLSSEAISDDKRLQRYAEIISQQNERLNAQVEKVLSIARLDDSEFKLKPESVDLNEIVSEVVYSKKAELVGLPGATLALELDNSIPMLEADKLHLTNVIYNLLDNAVKYSDGIPQVSVRTGTRDGHVELSVTDRGIGISDEHQKNLFRKFYRVPTGNVHNVKGFGLGLHYVKRIIDQHNWKIRVNSRLGEGTTMRIVF